MANRDAAGLSLQHFYTAPDGNLSRHYKEVVGDGTAYADNDRVYSIHIPQGTLIHEVTAVVTTVNGAAAAFDVGLAQKGPGTFVDDLDKYLDGEAGATLGSHRSLDNTREKPFRVRDKNVHLTITWRDPITAANAVWAIGLYVDYEYVGTL